MKYRFGLALALVLVALPASILAASHDIKIVDLAYEPPQLTVFTGEPVTWTNTGARTHTVTSDQGTELDSGNLAPAEGYGHVFETPGTFAYHCESHPGEMKGTITVVAAPATLTPGGSLEPTPPEGTLPPNFSPFPSTGPLSTLPPTSSPGPSPSPTTGSASGSGPLLIGLVAVLVIAAGLVVWYGRSRRR
jgi:LPXTG-motif cell wall-anchored protein